MKRNIEDFKVVKDLECAFCEKQGTHWLMEAESPDDSIGKRTLVCQEHYEAIKSKNE